MQLAAYGPRSHAELDKALHNYCRGDALGDAEAVLVGAGVLLALSPANPRLVCLPEEATLLAAIAAPRRASSTVTLKCDRATRVFARQHALRLGIADVRTRKGTLVFCTVNRVEHGVHRRLKRAGDAGIYVGALLENDDGSAWQSMLNMIASKTAVYIDCNKRVYLAAGGR